MTDQKDPTKEGLIVLILENLEPTHYLENNLVRNGIISGLQKMNKKELDYLNLAIITRK